MAKIKKIKLPNDNSPRDIVDAGAVRYDEAQVLTDAQKTQARTNIGVDSAIDAAMTAKNFGDIITHDADEFALASDLEDLQEVIEDAVEVSTTSLDATISGMGVGKTIKTLTETDGIIAATFEDISITKSQISDMPTTMKNPNALTIGGKTYDGSSAISVSAADLGIANAMHFVGKSTVVITDGSTTDPVISGYSTKTAGDVILDKDGKVEYIWTGIAWEDLGDGNSYVVKETGKGLSTNDYDTTAKAKVDAIPDNPKYTDTVYDDTALAGRVTTIEGKETNWDAAYTHSQATHARTDATKVEASNTNGNIKIDGTETSVYTHPTKTAASASANKVGYDTTGHVVLGDALAGADISMTGYAKSSATGAIATTDTVSAAIGKLEKALDAISDAVEVGVSTLDATITGMGVGKTLATLTETNGVIAATFQDISINQSQINQNTGDVLVFNCGSSTEVI